MYQVKKALRYESTKNKKDVNRINDCIEELKNARMKCIKYKKCTRRERRTYNY